MGCSFLLEASPKAIRTSPSITSVGISVDKNCIPRATHFGVIRRAFWYGIAANGASYALGWVVVNLVWSGLISL